MLVDDPVKRVDNMTMAWGLEGRVPFLDHELVELAATCPPNLKTAQGGKGVLKEAARRVIPSEVIDRPKGYFPVPALTHLEGPYLDMVRDALYAPVAKERGLFQPRCGRRAARRPQRPADPVARQRTVADRAAGTVAAEARHFGSRGMTTRAAERPDDHPEAITLGLHDASPPHMVDAMANDVVLELGWGRLIFGQTFADADKLAEVLRGETHGRRDICIYARESHVLVSLAPAELFIDPSHTYRLRFTEDDEPAAAPSGFTVRPLGAPEDADTINRVYVRCGMVPAPVDVIWDNQQHNDAVDYLIAVRDDDDSIVGTVTGVDHEKLFDDPENGSSLWTLAVDPTSSLPGVGAALTRTLADDFRDARSLVHGPVGGVRQRRRHRASTRSWASSGFRCWRSSERTRSTNRCSPTRPKPSTTSIRMRASSPTKRCGVESGSRYWMPKPVRCGCRTAAAASSPESRCRSTPPQSR